MKQPSPIQVIQNNIAQNRIKESLNFLTQLVKGQNRDWEMEVALLSSQFSQLELNSRIGILSYNEESVSRAKIINAILNFANMVTQVPAKVDDNIQDISNVVPTVIKPSIKVFISYAHEDKPYCEALSKHLKGLERKGDIEVWNDGNLIAGEEWDDEIKAHLQQADIVLFLVSSDFTNSDYIHRVELKAALERYNANQLPIIPIIVRACDFASLDLSRFQALPPQAKPVKSWTDQDEAWVEVVKGLKKVIAKFPERK